MTSKAHVEQLGSDDVAAAKAVIGQALNFDAPLMQFWLDTIGWDNYRVAKVDGRVAAGLGIIGMGQWWGGRRVPLAGITAVGVAPEYRGAGIGAMLMQATLHEIRAAGTPISALYASTLGFYRSVGYERAGTRNVYELPIHAIPRGDHTLPVVPLPTEERALPQRLHNTQAPTTPGKLDRSSFSWERLLAVPGVLIRTYAVLHGNEPQGYVMFAQSDGQEQPLRVRDFCALTPQAGQRLLTLLGDHRTMVPGIAWGGTPNDPIVTLLPEQSAKITYTEDWLLRIVDVAGALNARGYHPALRAELHLEVRDPVLHENSGRYVVQIADGAAQVERGGAGTITLDVRDLAAIYTAHHTPFERRYSGTISGPDDALALLGLVFAGPPPRMNDMF